MAVERARGHRYCTRQAAIGVPASKATVCAACGTVCRLSLLLQSLPYGGSSFEALVYGGMYDVRCWPIVVALRGAHLRSALMMW